MHEPSRRRVLAVGAGCLAALAGCGAPGSDGDGTPTPAETPTPTPRPALPADAPESWGYLQTPARLQMEPYAIGSLGLDALREGGLVQRNLSPNRYSPSDLQPAFEATTELLTVSTPDAAGGVLFGGYDPQRLSEALEADGYERTAGGDRYRLEGVLVEPGSDRIVWADVDVTPEAVVDGLLASAAEVGSPYPAADPKLGTVLGQLTAADARFARPLSADDGPFADARFIGTGIAARDGGVTWRTAVSFDGMPPESARDTYQSQFEDKDGFENVTTRLSEGLLVMDATTSAPWATSTQPI